MKKVIIESIGYGLFDARIDDNFDIRGVGGSKLEAARDLLANMQEDCKEDILENCKLLIAI